jgi:hypothetical protein
MELEEGGEEEEWQTLPTTHTEPKIVSKPLKVKAKPPPSLTYRESSIESPVEAFPEEDPEHRMYLSPDSKDYIAVPLAIIP